MLLCVFPYKLQGFEGFSGERPCLFGAFLVFPKEARVRGLESNLQRVLELRFHVRSVGKDVF